MANFNYDIQEYFTERQERADLVMALAGTRSTSNTEVEGSTKGGSKINSKEDSVYNSHSHSVMDQKETTNGYSVGYTLGHGEASTKEDSLSDSISNLLSNTYTTENGWSHEDSESTTESNGRTFGNSYSNSIMNEITMEEAKSISNETIYSKVESNSVSYQIRQSISDQPDDNGCYSYEVTPNILSEATVWACGTTNARLGDHVKFYTSEYSKYETNKYIINKTGCSYNEDSRNFRILENDIYNLKMDIQRGVKNNMIMGDTLTAPNPISSFEESVDYSGSYISTIDSNSDPNIRKPSWFFGLSETGELALCKDKFDTNHIRWSTNTKIPISKDINAHSLNVQFKIAKNGHLIMTANNILANYNIEDDDEYKVDTSQELVIWDSLPVSLPFNVGHYGNTGYTLIIEEINGGSSCQVVLYDGLLSPIWKIQPINPDDDDVYRGYAFPIEYNLPLRFKTEISNDKHNYIEKTAKTNPKHPSEIIFKCDMKFKENERMVSDNGKYSFYLQSTGNLVVKEYERTMWSSNTAILEPFNGPFTLSFSPIGELVLRDKYKYIMWRTINPYIVTNADKLNINNTDMDIPIEKSNEPNKPDKPVISETNNPDDTTIGNNDTNQNDQNDSINEPNNPNTNPDEEEETIDLINLFNDLFGDDDENNMTKRSDDNNNIMSYYYKLKLTDNGELKIIDNYGDTIWSNWFVRKNNYYMLYTEPLVYAISSCNEELRLPYVYNLHSYEQPKHDNIIVDPYYNNLLPGEKLVYQYDNTVYLALNETQLVWKLGYNEYTIESCEKTKELKLLDNGLKLICEDISKDIAVLPRNKNYTLTIKENLRNEDFKIIIMDMETHTIEWSYEPIKRLTSLENKESVYMDKIIIANNFTTYDRLYSKTEKDKFVYISNDFGLQLINKGYLANVYQMSINETAFIINEDVIVNNVKNMKLEYDSKINALLLSNKLGNNLWKYYGYINCEKLVSNNEKCNTIYSLLSVEKTDHPWLQLTSNGKLYGSFMLELLNIQHYLNITDPIYSLKLNNIGDIVINDDKFLHKEYYKSEDYYTLELIDGNSKDYDLINEINYTNEKGETITNNNINNEITLVLKSSRGEYKWCNNYIYNRPLYASRLYINDSFTKGEMLYCNNYSLIILDGKLIYRDHVKLTEVPNVNLVKLVITDRNLILISDNKVQYELTNRLSNRNTNTFLSCNFNDNSVYWDDGNGKVLWKYSVNNSSNSKSDAVWLYNRYYNKCLYAEPNEMITYEDCKNKDKYKWYYENIDGDTYFKSASKGNLCMKVNKSGVVIGNCNKNAIMKYIKTSKFIKNNDKCISGIDDKDDPNSQYYVKLNSCDRHNKKQQWEFIYDINDILN